MHLTVLDSTHSQTYIRTSHHTVVSVFNLTFNVIQRK